MASRKLQRKCAKGAPGSERTKLAVQGGGERGEKTRPRLEANLCKTQKKAKKDIISWGRREKGILGVKRKDIRRWTEGGGGAGVKTKYLSAAIIKIFGDTGGNPSFTGIRP